MHRTRWVLPLFLALMIVPGGALMACLWDYDTLKMERARFPSALELIVGKFPRHSREFYQWRVQDRLKKLETEPSRLDFYDDLAVAYEKLDQHDRAIETMLAKDKLQPGLYETEANLGTFYLHAGRVGEGLIHIERALAINPDAHFGREKYQKLLAEYVRQRRQAGQTGLPLAAPIDNSEGMFDFAAFLRKQNGDRFEKEDYEAAIKGILGMMRFGNHDSPILLEALGCVLAGPGLAADFGDDRNFDAKRLAARAFLRAAQVVSEPEAKTGYRRMAEETVYLQTPHPQAHDGIDLSEIEADLAVELADAERWNAEVVKNERIWLREAKDPEQEFAARYFTDPLAADTQRDYTMQHPAIRVLIFLLTVGVVITAIVWVSRKLRRKSVAPRAST